jgi:multisubunit Na+/H+ antiporter MnhF subunit
MLALLPLVARGTVFDRIVVQQFFSLGATLVVVALAQAFGQSSFLVVALTLALLAFPSALVYARFFERWL